MSWTWCLGWTLFFGIIDILLPRSIRQHDNSRWFAIHVMGNLVLIWYTANDLWQVIINPLHDVVLPEMELSWENRKGPSIIIMIMHLYHILFFKNLKPVDWLHHLVSAFGSGGVGLFMDWGKGVNAQIFFLSGLPGGIDYFLLLLVKLGCIPSRTEKQVNVYLNLCIRIPGLLFLASIIYVNMHFHQNLAGLPLFVGWIAVLSNVWNGLYFGNRVFASYYSSK